MAQLKPGAKKFRNIALIVIPIIVGIVFLYNKGYFDGILKSSATIKIADLPNAPKLSAGSENLVYAGEPSSNVTAKDLGKVEFNINIMAWNSQLGLLFANGGASTTEGSLMEQSGVKVNITRQDDIVKACEDLITFSEAFSKDPEKAKGINAFAMMGDGAPVYISTLKKQMAKYGDKPVIIGSAGNSLGEDAVLGPLAWRNNPQLLKGATIATVVLDGDWNIAVKYAGDNGVDINTDDKTYDPNALNFINVSSNVDAGEKYIAGYTESRPVVVKGKKTGETKKIKIDGVAVWTPVDVTVATSKRGIDEGLVRIISTKEYASQMPNVIITSDNFAKANPKVIENFLDGLTKGGDQVRAYSQALSKAGEISAKVYGEQNGEWWVKYAKGDVYHNEKQNLDVELGGSSQFNLADNLQLFGASGSTNLYSVVYETFGEIAFKYYPERFDAGLVPADSVVDYTYLNNIKSRNKVKTEATKQTYAKSDNLAQVVSDKDWSIEFATNKADLTPTGKATVREIYKSLITASTLKAVIAGHTDNVGSESINLPLSEARANAVKAELQRLSPDNFPDNRLIVRGYGSERPLASNLTKAGQAKNRRVQVSLGN